MPRNTSFAIWIGSTAPASRAEYPPWASGTSLLHQPRLAEWLCRTADRIDAARVRGPFRRLGRGASAPNPASLCPLLQQYQNTPVIGQRCAGLSPRPADRIHSVTRDPWPTSSPLCPGLGFRYAQVPAPAEKHAHSPVTL